MAGDVGLDAVSETLFLRIYALALESRRPDPIMVDEGAVELTRRLNEYFAVRGICPKGHERTLED